MPTAMKYGKFYMKDSSGNLVQVVPEAMNIIPDYQGATASSTGISGLVPAAQSSQRNKFLRGDGTWAELELITADDAEDIFDDVFESSS